MAHVPTVATTQLELLTFRQALEAANTPCWAPEEAIP